MVMFLFPASVRAESWDDSEGSGDVDDSSMDLTSVFVDSEMNALGELWKFTVGMEVAGDALNPDATYGAQFHTENTDGTRTDIRVEYSHGKALCWVNNRPVYARNVTVEGGRIEISLDPEDISGTKEVDHTVIDSAYVSGANGSDELDSEEADETEEDSSTPFPGLPFFIAGMLAALLIVRVRRR